VFAVIGCASTPGPTKESSSVDGSPATAPGIDTAEGQPNGPAKVALCDGTDRMRLWVLVEPTGDREVRGSIVRVENGLPLLMVDGTCKFWIGAGWSEDALSRDRALRTGKLSAADSKALEAALPLDDLMPLGDCKAVAGHFDASILAIRAERSSARCATSGNRFGAAWAAVQTIARTLWNQSVPLDGPIHVSAVEAPFDNTGSAKPYDWPITTPMASFLIPDGRGQFASGASRLVMEPDAAKKLRAMRDQYLADRGTKPGLYVNWDGMKVSEEGKIALVFMRDALPYEDARGLLQF